jgi:hypothetical protein
VEETDVPWSMLNLSFQRLDHELLAYHSLNGRRTNSHWISLSLTS